MLARCWLRRLLLAALLIPAPSIASAQNPLNLKIINNSQGFQDTQVCLMFGGITSGFDGTATVNGPPNTALALGTPYALSQISDIPST